MLDGVIGKIVKGRYVPNGLQERMDKMIKAGTDCTLTEADFDDFRAAFKAVSWSDTAQLYMMSVSNVVFTMEWIESFVHMAGQGTVVEYASASPLKQAMEDRGLIWDSTAPVGGADVLFYPWVNPMAPPQSRFLGMGMPIILIASDKAIDAIQHAWFDASVPYTLVAVTEVFDWFSDVRCWPDFEARTWVALPQGTALIVGDLCLAGPGRKRQTL